MDEKIVLICTPLRFYTQTDEEQCFKWIKKIKLINSVEGAGRELHLIMESDKITNKDLFN